MLIIIFLLQPILSSSNNDFYQQVSLPLYNVYTIETIEDKGLIYKYYLTEETNKFTLTTYCKAYPSHLKINVQYQLRVSHQTEKQFQLDFINGTYYGKTSLIQKAIVTNYGIFILTTDKILEFIQHDTTESNILTQKFQLEFIDSIDNSEIFYIEESNRLILLNDDFVFEYEIVTNELFDYTLSFIRKYQQSQIKIPDIKLLKLLGPYIFLLTNDGNLNIYDSDLKKVYTQQENIIFFSFSLDKNQPKLLYIDGNFTFQSKQIQMNQDDLLIFDYRFEHFPNASMFVEYQSGFLIVEEQEQGSIIIDYQFINDEWNKIQTHYVQLKIKNIVIEQNYAILISENTQKIITVGIDGKIVNKQNFKQKNIDSISGLQDILVFEKTENEIDTVKHIYAYTRSKVLKLDLLHVQFQINCTCQNETEALNSPYNVKLEYYSSTCEDCETVRQYIINFNYTILTQDSINQVLVGIMIGISLYLIIIGIILKKYLQYRKCIQQSKNGSIPFETIQTSPKDASITDNKLEFNSVVQEKVI